MKSISETGHAKNVANLKELIAFINGYGTAYNPSKTSLTILQLNTLHTQADTDLEQVINKNTDYNNAINERVKTFEGLRALSTRLINALAVTDASKEKVDDAKGFNRKIQGQRASKKEEPLDPSQPAPKTISTSRQSYDQLIQHFGGIISVLNSEPTYTPNEAALSIATLQAKAQDLKDKNEQVAVAYTELSNARINRNKTLYDDNTGLVVTAGEVKKYIKSVFGATSPEFAMVKGIKFKKENI